LFSAGNTNAFYNDRENSSGNVFFAGSLDFRLTNNNLNKIIGPEALGEVSHSSVAMPENGSLPMQYVLNASIATTTSNSDFCNALMVEAKDNGVTKYSGPIGGLTSATTTDFGTWEFRFDLPPSVSVPHGAKCDVSALFSAWRQDTAEIANSGWQDEESLDISFTARMVVLNEILASPASEDREFIELYNNGSTDVHLAGWKLSEISGSTEKFYTISTTTGAFKTVSQSGSTIIPVHGFLAFYLSDSTALNNTGDTIKLYDNSSTLLDTHKYPAVPVGKSVVRFPDGIGFWVDPEPTPGASNIVSFEDLRIAGFNDSMIREILELASLKNTAILTIGAHEGTPVLDLATTTASTTESAVFDLLATTTPETILENDPTATTTPEITTETASTTPEIILIPSPSQGESGGEVVSKPEPMIEPGLAIEPEPVAEVAPIIETPAPESPPNE
jgi:hypothetical protein